MVDDTTRVLGLDGLAVVAVEDDSAGGPVVHLVTADEGARRCPACGSSAVRVKQWTTTRPRDLPVVGRVCRLRWGKPVVLRQRRLRAAHVHRVGGGGAVAGLVDRPATRFGGGGGCRWRTYRVQAARDHGMSWPVVAAAFATRAAAMLPDQPEPVQVLGIDEVRCGRPHWVLDETTGAWRTAGERWHVGFCDLSGGQGLLGQIEGRATTTVLGWLLQRPQAWRDAVRYVAIDMCTISAGRS